MEGRNRRHAGGGYLVGRRIASASAAGGRTGREGLSRRWICMPAVEGGDVAKFTFWEGLGLPRCGHWTRGRCLRKGKWTIQNREAAEGNADHANPVWRLPSPSSVLPASAMPSCLPRRAPSRVVSPSGRAQWATSRTRRAHHPSDRARRSGLLGEVDVAAPILSVRWWWPCGHPYPRCKSASIHAGGGGPS